jgi:hypothetical protein
MPEHDVVLVHRGGLGDFLMAWPAILSICGASAGASLYWYGPTNRLPWLRPLGVSACSPKLRVLVDDLFSRSCPPPELDAVTIYWFVLRSPPPIPSHANLRILPGIAPSDWTCVRDTYARALRQCGIAWQEGWLGTWRGLFSRPRQTSNHVLDQSSGETSGQTSSQTSGPRSPQTSGPGSRQRSGHAFSRSIPSKTDGPGSQGKHDALLFPGAGHPAKQWPLVQFFELADWLLAQGWSVQFVLGPAEVERGMTVQPHPALRPTTLEELQDLLLAAGLVVGNDSGPMHLAGMLGVPGVALFGPASELQWGPVGLGLVSLDHSCRPCTRTGRISCRQPRCMLDLSQEMVRAEIMRATKNRFCS